MRVAHRTVGVGLPVANPLNRSGLCGRLLLRLREGAELQGPCPRACVRARVLRAYVRRRSLRQPSTHLRPAVVKMVTKAEALCVSLFCARMHVCVCVCVCVASCGDVWADMCDYEALLC